MKRRPMVNATASATAFVMLAGCSSSWPPVGSRVAWSSQVGNGSEPSRQAPWLEPGASRIQKLLYAGDYDSATIDIYDFSTGKEVGTLGGFKNPGGECVDKTGDVFLTEQSGSLGAVLEYAHGGEAPIKTFNTDGHPIGCSISPKGGDLAVANGIASGSDVQVWKHAAGSPTQYVNQDACSTLWSPGYDNKGNLFAENGTANSVCELPFQGASLVSVSFSHDIGFSGSAMWDGKYMTFTDQLYNGDETAIYRAKQNASGGLDVTSTTVLTTKRCGADVGQPFIVGSKNTPANTQQGNTVIGGNGACYYRSPIWFWAYPRGGGPFRRIRRSPMSSAGVSVSIKT